MNRYKIITPIFTLLVSAVAQVVLSVSAIADPGIEEIVVFSDFRDSTAQSATSSLTVLSTVQLESRAAQHLENVLNLAPNVNSAAGASRGRFFQIRGVGERSQFKEPLDSSVGLVVDGVDFSNLGLAGGIYDVDQVEVLRGPQGTTFGSNAMAGLIYIQSAAPTEEFEGRVDISSGNYDAQSTGVVLSGPLNSQLLGRIAINKNTSDGYIENTFLQRDDSNNIDELSARVKVRWTASADLNVDFTAVYIDADNGYDAFSLRNSRVTRSDAPGHDRQESTALSILATWEGSDAYTLEAQVTTERSNLEYGFDWDWSDFDTVGVRGFENNVRDRRASSIDLRFLSKPDSEILGGASWVAGIYAYDREVDLSYSEVADYYGAWTDGLISSFDSSRYAAYGQLDWMLSEQWLLSLGSRFEHFENDYFDSFGVVGGLEDDLIGGKLSLQYLVSDDVMIYGAVSQGYKTGGLNTDAFGKALVSGDAATIALLNQQLTYEDEAALNYELGLKGSYLDASLTVNLTAFYIDRQNMQAKLALEITTGNWTSYRANIDGSNNYGIELETDWQVTEQFRVFAALGLLQSKLGDLVALDVDKEPLDQTGRDQAHAPDYQFNVGVAYRFMDHYSLTVQMDGKDSFFFSNSHNQQSSVYELLHAKFNYQQGPLTLSLWGRNLADKDYAVRGFYFGNNPNNGWIAESYTQLGEPRVFGISGQYDF